MSSKAFQRWRTHSALAAAAAGARAFSAGQVVNDDGHAAGYAAGLERGLADGRQQAAEQLAADGARLAGLFDSLAAPLADVEQDVVDSVLQLACALARQVVRRELTAMPARISELIREGVAALPPTARQITVHLNPQDMDLVRSAAPRGRNDARWELLADASLDRGGCRITTESSEVDLTLETRLAEVFAQLTEDEEA